MVGDGLGGLVPTLPTIPTLPAIPTLPTIPPLPIPTLPTVPTLPTTPTLPPPPVTTTPPPPVTTTPPGPSVPTVPGSGSPTPPPVPSTPPSGTSGSPGSPPLGPPNPNSTTTGPPANCSSPSSPPTTSTPETSEPPDETSTPPSEPSETTEPEPETTTTVECEPTGAGPTQSLPGQIAEADLALVAVLASAEVLAVNAYTIARDEAAAGSFGDVPAALANFADTVLGHHQAALLSWNGALLRAGLPPVTRAPVDAAASLNVQLSSVADAMGVAKVALSLERLVAATYLDALQQFASEQFVRLAGSILSIDRQHMSVLLFTLGSDPVPETFATVEFAYVP